MKITNKNIDGGKPFDWSNTSADYAAFRDIYPQEFYNKIAERNLCINRQRALDIGTGTGVLPRNMYKFGAKWTGVDISPNQIAMAKRLSKGMDINYRIGSAEGLDFADNSFDVITACQCFWYFDHLKAAKKMFDILRPGGSLVILCMEWLPFEDKIAAESERLVLKYNPYWSGAAETMHPIEIPDCYKELFEFIYHDEYILKVPFTRAGWHGRIKACRAIGASLSEQQIELWQAEHKKLLSEIAPDEFDVLHYGAIAELRKKA